jgi:hypothetical protein
MQALFMVNLFVKDEVIPCIVDVDELEECWILLINLYESNNTTGRLMLKSHLYNIKMEKVATWRSFCLK